MKTYQERLQEEEDIRIGWQTVNDKNEAFLARQREIIKAIDAGALADTPLLQSELEGLKVLFGQIAKQRSALRHREEELSREHQLGREAHAQSIDYVQRMEQLLAPGGRLDQAIQQAEAKVLPARQAKATALDNLLEGYRHMATYASPEAAAALAKKMGRDLSAPANASS